MNKILKRVLPVFLASISICSEVMSAITDQEVRQIINNLNLFPKTSVRVTNDENIEDRFSKVINVRGTVEYKTIMRSRSIIRSPYIQEKILLEYLHDGKYYLDGLSPKDKGFIHKNQQAFRNELYNYYVKFYWYYREMSENDFKKQLNYLLTFIFKNVLPEIKNKNNRSNGINNETNETIEIDLGRPKILLLSYVIFSAWPRYNNNRPIEFEPISYLINNLPSLKKYRRIGYGNYRVLLVNRENANNNDYRLILRAEKNRN